MILLGLATAAASACNLPTGWTTPVPVRAALSQQMRFALQAGKAYRLSLAPARTVRLSGQTSHSAKPQTWAGIGAIDVTARGKLTISLSSATYVDLIRDGLTQKSVAHARTESCPTMHKTVTFDVVPGRYLVQLTDAPDRNVVIEATFG